MCTPFAAYGLTRFPTHGRVCCCGTLTVSRHWNAALRGIQLLNCQRAPWHVLGLCSLAFRWTFPVHAPWISTRQMIWGQENNPESVQFTRHCQRVFFVIFSGDVMLQSGGLGFCGSLYGWSVFLLFKSLSYGGWQEGGKQ